MARQLVICGMHRSATSLVASALQRAGLDLGRELAGPGPGNRRGHFEDLEFRQLHEEMLAAAGAGCFTARDGFAPPADPAFERRARALVAAREALPLWGWKDPRTCLFLDFWDPLLPRARYLMLYRHPVDVALSLWRRGNDAEVRRDPWLAVSAWEVYNRRLLTFLDRFPERCFLAQVPALAADLGGLVERLRDRLGLPVCDGAAGAVLAPAELTPSTPPNPAWEAVIPSALALYRRLEERADLPARESNADAFAGRPDRERELLLAGEALLHALFVARSGDPGRLDRTQIRDLVSALAEEQRRAAELAAALDEEQERSARAAADRDALARVLTEIETSRGFAPVRAWWRLRRWLGKGRTPAIGVQGPAPSAAPRSGTPSPT